MTTAGTRLGTLLLTVAIGGVLITDAAVVGVRQRDRGSHSTVNVTAPKDGPKPTGLEAALPELVAFVEQSRGLKFKRPPKVELLTNEKFEARLRKGDEPGGDPASDPQADADVI